jgi:secreted trypsin-like serine protease
MRFRGLCAGLAVLVTCIAAAPAGAVVGGEKITPQDVPWFTFVGPCGGTLVAPDRVLTAAHCVGGRTPGDLGQTLVNGELRDFTHIAMHPGWRHANGGSYLDDVAIVQLSAPVTSVAPVALGGSGTEPARIIGAGQPFAPGTGHSESEMYNNAGLRQATLRQVSDTDCAEVYRHNTPGTGEHFNAARMRCAVDEDGREPLSSGCFGDSGGPLVAGTNAAPVQLGIVSWGGDKCGADHSPSVFADVNRYRTFITDPTPTWGPTQHTTVKVSGSKTLTCSAAHRERGTTLSYAWKRSTGHSKLDTVGTGRRYKPTKSDAGHRLVCFANASNDGGEILAGSGSVMVGR